MSNIYLNSASADRKVYLNVPIAPESGSLDVTVSVDGVVVFSVTTITSDANGLSFTLPFFLVDSDSELEIHWTFNYIEEGITYQYDEYTTASVVTPILPLSEIKTIVGSEFTDAQVEELESAVRYIIQAHTGQFFGKFIGKKWVSGSGETYLRLPSRLISLTSINDNIYWNEGLAVRGSGWYLQSKAYGVPSIRADFDGYHENPWSGKAPIIAPNSKNLFNFIEHAEYTIDGTWGWRSVPEQVKQAAKLLINDYACGDNNYRDRFLTSMTAADWKIQFHEGAFSNTGNVRANQLLAEFVLRRGWVVI